MKKALKFALYITLSLLFVLPLACSKDDDKNSEEPITESSECSQIELDVQAIFPTGEVVINGIEENLKDNLIVEYWYNDVFTNVATYLGTNENDEPYIVAPVHPEFPLKGGEIQVVFKDLNGKMLCLPKSLTITELPKADGYTDQVVLGLQNLLKQRTDFLNIDEATLSGDLANIQPTEVPFALLYNLLNNEEAEFALIPFLNNGDVSTNEGLDKASSIDLTNRLLKKHKVLEYINQRMNNFEAKSGKKNEAQNSLERCPKDIDAEGLAAQMKSAAFTEYKNPDFITGKYFEDLSNLATIAGLFPGKIGVAGDVLGTIVFLIQTTEEAYSKTRLSHFTKFEFTVAKTDFLEETACSTPIDSAVVYAASDDWALPKTIFESCLQFASILSTREIEKGSPLNDYIEEFGFKFSRVFTIDQLKNLSKLGNWVDDELKIDAIECGPISVLNHKYIKANPLNNVFEADYKEFGGIELYPIATGKDILEVSLRPEYFSEQTISATQELNLTPIELKWVKPTSNPYFIEPGDPVNLEAHLKNTENLDLIVNSPEGHLENGVGVSLDSIQKFTLQTPTDPSKYPFTVTAEFKSTHCFRGSEYANPIIEGIVIQIGKVMVYSNDESCFEVGGSRNFYVDIYGDDKQVEWSAKNESGQDVSISQDGHFTAPNHPGLYYITATLKNNPEIFDTLEVEVVESCTCYWNYTGGDFDITHYNAGYYLNGSGGLQINLGSLPEATSNETITILVNSSYVPKEGESLESAGINDLNNPTSNLLTITGFSFPPGQTNVFGPKGNYNITLKLENQYLEGKITGTMIIPSDENDNSFPFTLTFGAYDENSNLFCE